ncbi:MAG: DUF5131 family protein [Pseudomonadota bacterium]|nr:DUF5131 family protein [Pseudomonadota bacterium]
MAEHSKIEWTDATVNFWWGCTKVGPGCDHCYAEGVDRRYGGAHWGAGAPRRKIKGAVALLHRLNRTRRVAPGGRRFRVFIQSMSDLFDKEVPTEWVREAGQAIKAATHLDIQIVTKRLPMVEKRMPDLGWDEWPKHAGLMVSVVNQPEADRDVPRLLEMKERLDIPWVGISAEPLLGPLDLRHWIGHMPYVGASTHGGPDGLRQCDISGSTGLLDWCVAGGESGPGWRDIPDDVFRSLRDQCAAASVPYFQKQMPGRRSIPDDLMVRQWPEAV